MLSSKKELNEIYYNLGFDLVLSRSSSNSTNLVSSSIQALPRFPEEENAGSIFQQDFKSNFSKIGFIDVDC